MASAYLSEDRRDAAQAAGAAAVLRKRVTLDCLRQRVAQVLSARGR